ncbi:hypothetical protein [Fimbriiglobus ruber]|uniref:Uncharacterized protein n=1 Tax=Fimbriiglobus ruber TaxID=1908690 RepID=A0A225DU53_9BACT|nr:hypothetical protein [Fimbriiglobus ruber]OWK45040.1 hypothetical protein FRUB_01371 [Fimbriiglobus ruber]
MAALGNPTLAAERVPCATTVRSWVLRLGYAQLTRPLSHDHRWAWLVDHTIQIGSQKLLAIVGVVLDHAPFGVRPLERADLHLVDLVPMDTSNHARVDAALQRAVARTGPPRQIVSDGATDLCKGIQDFRARHPDTLGVPDVAHHVANLLKHYWEADPQWTAFVGRMTATAATLRQTRAAHLVAPKLRAKARYMSVATFVRFGRLVAAKLRAATPDPEVVTHYGWVAAYADALTVWHEQHALVQATLRIVRVEGLFARTPTLVDDEWARLTLSDHPTTVRLRNRLRAYVDRWSRAAHPGERLIGSTEILESAFGLQKRLSRDQAASGFTGLSLGVGAMIGTATPSRHSRTWIACPRKSSRTGPSGCSDQRSNGCVASLPGPTLPRNKPYQIQDELKQPTTPTSDQPTGRAILPASLARPGRGLWRRRRLCRGRSTPRRR